MVVGVLAILLVMLSTAFQLIIIAMATFKGISQVTQFQLLPLTSLGVTVVITFYHLCNAATAMTREVKECVLQFRQHPNIDQLPAYLKEKVLLFIEKISKPPRVTRKSVHFGTPSLPNCKWFWKTTMPWECHIIALAYPAKLCLSCRCSESWPHISLFLTSFKCKKQLLANHLEVFEQVTPYDYLFRRQLCRNIFIHIVLLICTSIKHRRNDKRFVRKWTYWKFRLAKSTQNVDSQTKC